MLSEKLYYGLTGKDGVYANLSCYEFLMAFFFTKHLIIVVNYEVKANGNFYVGSRFVLHFSLFFLSYLYFCELYNLKCISYEQKPDSNNH